MRFCCIVIGLLLGPVVLASGANTLKLPEGAAHPEHHNQAAMHETKSQGLALVPPHRLDDSLPKEKLNKQPLVARVIKVDKSINKNLQDRLKKLGYFMNTMQSWSDKETGSKTTQTFLLTDHAEVKKEVPLENLTVILHWVTDSKALLMMTNAKGEYLALRDYKPFVKAFSMKKIKKSKASTR
jgi:hypothetical protein